MLPIPEHPLRQQLNQELHARPPLPLSGPTWVSHLAVLHQGGQRAQEEAHLHKLCGLLGSDVCPVVAGDHWVLESTLGESRKLRLKWERHNEFSTYTFFLDRLPGDTDDANALHFVPADWLPHIPGELIAATHIEFRPTRSEPDLDGLLDNFASRPESVVGSRIANGAGWVFSDFRLHDGFSRFLVLDDHLRHRQAGRTIQRLVEIETYRMLALLTFPVAKEVGRLLARIDGELTVLMQDMRAERTAHDERRLLGELTRLAAEVEGSISRSAFRFGAAAAYYRLVLQRIDDLREVRIDGFPPIREFMDRRLAPALNTCASIAARQQDLSSRIARKSALLRTRVDIELEQQNQQLLSQMNRRAHLQLRLQQTVEGLSVVVLTYYGSQLVQYLAKGSKELHHLNTDVITAIAIPVIAGIVFWGTRRLHHKLAAAEQAEAHAEPEAHTL